MEDKRSKKIAFVPFCTLCQCFQAKGIVKGNWSSTIYPVIQKLIEKDINIIQLPCPESSFNGYNKGLKREPAGLKKYDTLEYNNHCKILANQVIQMIESSINEGYEIIGVFGIENLPTCAVNYIYSNKGMLKRKGIFIENLYAKAKNMDINFIGINRKSLNKTIEFIYKIS